MNEIVPASRSDLSKEFERLEGVAVSYADASMSANTKRAYQADMKHFLAWCEKRGLAVPSTPQTIALYIASMASDEHKSSATIQRHLAAIRKWHQLQGLADPTDSEHVRRVWKGIRKTIGCKPNPKKALLRSELHACVDALPEDAQGVRDRALLLFGFESAMRRSEIASMERSWLEFGTKGVLVTFPFSKTNQEGELEQIVVERREDHCPVGSLEAWLLHHDNPRAFVQFTNRRVRLDEAMTGWGISRVIKRAVGVLDFDAIEYAGHSLRRGFVTTSHRDGKSVETIMETTRHNVGATVRRYIEQDDLRRRIGEPIKR